MRREVPDHTGTWCVLTAVRVAPLMRPSLTSRINRQWRTKLTKSGQPARIGTVGSARGWAVTKWVREPMLLLMFF